MPSFESSLSPQTPDNDGTREEIVWAVTPGAEAAAAEQPVEWALSDGVPTQEVNAAFQADEPPAPASGVNSLPPPLEGTSFSLEPPTAPKAEAVSPSPEDLPQPPVPEAKAAPTDPDKVMVAEERLTAAPDEFTAAKLGIGRGDILVAHFRVKAELAALADAQLAKGDKSAAAQTKEYAKTFERQFSDDVLARVPEAAEAEIDRCDLPRLNIDEVNEHDPVTVIWGEKVIHGVVKLIRKKGDNYFVVVQYRDENNKPTNKTFLAKYVHPREPNEGDELLIADIEQKATKNVKGSKKNISKITNAVKSLGPKKMREKVQETNWWKFFKEQYYDKTKRVRGPGKYDDDYFNRPFRPSLRNFKPKNTQETDNTQDFRNW